ncbi:MAG: hypothetical protein KDC44_15285 [Phaeodactylibacter sp.]|nr:hypothetical protein [Phaeodactylibacter sp.]
MKLPHCIALVVLLFFSCMDNPQIGAKLYAQPKVCGLNFVAPPRPYTDNPMVEVEAVAANWIAVIPYAFTRDGQPNVHYNAHKWQWWGERPEGCQRTVELAKAHHLKVMLKPQVYVPGSWTGAIDFKEATDWEQWEADYEAYILPMADMAETIGVDLFCVGTEFKIGAVKRPEFWRKLIKKVRERYSGQLVYAANWDEYQSITFWDELDYIGINAYFPLVNSATPSVKSLEQAWSPIAKQIKAFAQRVQKPVLFTEFGYLSVDGCAYNTWELEGQINQLDINEQAQANALDALFGTFWHTSYWAGGFLWKWFPEMKGHEGYPAKDYTPQGKLAEKNLKSWYLRK